jgi:putative endonuclease
MKTKLLGAFGEAYAAEYLRKKRCKILGMNYRCRKGELDIIARDGKQIVFVEVKLRKSRSFAEAKDYVDSGKQRKIRLAAEMWLYSNNLSADDTDFRYDIIEIYADETGGGVTELNHIKGAFD